jgi:DNA helicase II / ATP-dependent DNA helicase PcrA
MMDERNQSFEPTPADIEIEKCLNGSTSFSLIAGAGSGKTTSLARALKYIRKMDGRRLRRDGKRIVCITYTNRAVDVISSRVEWDDLFLISTLHHFLWGEIKGFTPDIRRALIERIIPAQIEKKRGDDNGGSSKKAIAARQKIAALEASLAGLGSVQRFEYSDTVYSDYCRGQLNHDDVIDIAADLISGTEGLQRIIGQKYPYILVDEAQDTFDNVVHALNSLCGNDGLPLIGYFGDPMQQIFEERAGNFEGPDGSVTITKKENYRCSPQVIGLLNAFRTDVRQVPAGENAQYDGSVLVTLVKAETPGGARNKYTDEQVLKACDRYDEALEAWGWASNPNVKRLFLVRRMIARRLGFAHLQDLFTGEYASSKAQEDYEKGGHFLLRPLIELLCPLVQAARAGDTKRVFATLRRGSPAFSPQGPNARKTIEEMKTLALSRMQELTGMWGTAIIGEILTFCDDSDLCEVSPQLRAHLNRSPRPEEYDAELHSIDKGDWLADSLLTMSTPEIEAFTAFVSENTPYSTQHGVKGEEYDDVLVVFDDTEAAWHQYSFGKMLLPSTLGEPTEGQRDRSRKLAYVCFSRAAKNLRILLFTPNPEAAKDELIRSKLFEETQLSIAQ